jgi:hypothetical protein
VHAWKKKKQKILLFLIKNSSPGEKKMFYPKYVLKVGNFGPEMNLIIDVFTSYRLII